MNELIIRIQDNGNISVEEIKDGVKSFKAITPDSLLACLNESIMRGSVSSGLLPRGCISYAAYDDGGKEVYILHPESRADISYFGSVYTDFPLPRLVFGFSITGEGRISKCRLGVVGNENHLKPSSPMFVYPFSNVLGTVLCIGNNVLPRIASLHQLSGVPYHILGMDNNGDHFKPSNNKPRLEMRGLLEVLKDKSPEYYYTDILVPCKGKLGEFIKDMG